MYVTTFNFRDDSTLHTLSLLLFSLSLTSFSLVLGQTYERSEWISLNYHVQYTG